MPVEPSRFIPGLDDLVADLGACAELCDAYPTQLAGVQVNAATLAPEARAMHATLSTTVRDRRLRTLTVTRHTNARDRAVAYLLEAMTEVREAGLFAFRNDPRGGALVPVDSREALATCEGRRGRGA
ncbi:MAG: hypothetical protein IPQ09_07250 [Myxococcales bacterium]|nr:hypothetical protein [Myxococcales bacterium]